MVEQPSLDAPQSPEPQSVPPAGNPPPVPISGRPANGRKPTWRTHLALGLVVATALFSLVQGILYFQPELFVAFFREDTPLPSDFVTRNERLLRCIADALPAEEVVGFVTDIEGAAHRERYRITQYVLAPILVDDSNNHRYIIGIFSNPNQPFPLDPSEFPPLMSCSPGIYLLQNNSTP